jgi:tetratricopeptide (TPR) repeat protein
MRFLLDITGLLGFRTQSLRSLAERRAYIRGIVCFSAGFLAFVGIRNSVYASLLDPILEPPGLADSLFRLNIIQAVLFLLLVYIPALILLSNAISGDGMGFSISRREYQVHASVLLPLWGLLLLIAAPLQLLIPQFLVVEEFGISIGLFILLALITIYSFWAVKNLNYLSPIQALGVFALSWITLPVFYLLTAFIYTLSFIIMIPLFYWGFHWIRFYFDAHSGERAFQQHLRTLTSNPQDADAHYQLGLIHLKRRNLEVARQYFSNALKIDPSDPDYHYFLGRTCELKKDWPEALERYESTYQIKPEYNQGDIIREVGKGYLHTGESGKAIEFLKYFLNKRDSDPEGRYWLALAMQKTGDTEQMRVQLNMILEQARSNPRFFRRENRDWIYRARSLLRSRN